MGRAPMWLRRATFLGLALSALVAARAAGADGRREALPLPGDDLSGRDIYQRVLENRFRSFTQVSQLLSADRAGSEQESRLRMVWKDFRTAEAYGEPGIRSKTLVRYTHPFDLRYSGYLIINNEGRPNDQFVYLASRRRVRRVSLRGEAVFGTDFSFEDVVPRELAESTYRRLPDRAIDGIPCYRVEATPLPDTRSEYSRFVAHVEKPRFVPILTQYWNAAGVEVKRLEVDPASIDDFDGVHVPMRMTMRNLLHESHTSLTIAELVANPDLGEGDFDLRRLETH